jgi:hypothetical protein
MAKLLDWVDGFLKYTDNTEPPILYKEWIACSVIASALRRKCYLPWGSGITFYPNLYIVLVGPSGKCRKGTAMGMGAQFLRELGVKMAAEAITREALIRELAGASETNVSQKNGKVYLHSSLTIFSQELTVFLGYNNQNLIADLTDWYDCRDPWIYRTKSQGTDEINGVWVNLIGATTPELIQSALPRDAIGGGLASRIIFVYEDNKAKNIAIPFQSEEELAMREKLIDRLDQIQQLDGQFTITNDFLDIYVPWYEKQHRHPPFKHNPNFAGYVERRPNHVMKLSMILSASSRTDMVIDGEILTRAINMLERTEVKMPQTFSGYGSAKTSDVIHRLMQYIAATKTPTHQQIMSTFYADVASERELNDMLTVLQRMGFISQVVKQTGTEYHYKKTKENDLL